MDSEIAKMLLVARFAKVNIGLWGRNWNHEDAKPKKILTLSNVDIDYRCLPLEGTSFAWCRILKDRLKMKPTEVDHGLLQKRRKWSDPGKLEKVAVLVRDAKKDKDQKVYWYFIMDMDKMQFPSRVFNYDYNKDGYNPLYIPHILYKHLCKALAEASANATLQLPLTQPATGMTIEEVNVNVKRMKDDLFDQANKEMETYVHVNTQSASEPEHVQRLSLDDYADNTRFNIPKEYFETEGPAPDDLFTEERRAEYISNRRKFLESEAGLDLNKELAKDYPNVDIDAAHGIVECSAHPEYWPLPDRRRLSHSRRVYRQAMQRMSHIYTYTLVSCKDDIFDDKALTVVGLGCSLAKYRRLKHMYDHVVANLVSFTSEWASQRETPATVDTTEPSEQQFEPSGPFLDTLFNMLRSEETYFEIADEYEMADALTDVPVENVYNIEAQEFTENRFKSGYEDLINIIKGLDKIFVEEDDIDNMILVCSDDRYFDARVVWYILKTRSGYFGDDLDEPVHTTVRIMNIFKHWIVIVEDIISKSDNKLHNNWPLECKGDELDVGYWVNEEDKYIEYLPRAKNIKWLIAKVTLSISIFMGGWHKIDTQLNRLDENIMDSTGNSTGPIVAGTNLAMGHAFTEMNRGTSWYSGNLMKILLDTSVHFIASHSGSTFNEIIHHKFEKDSSIFMDHYNNSTLPKYLNDATMNIALYCSIHATKEWKENIKSDADWGKSIKLVFESNDMVEDNWLSIRKVLEGFGWCAQHLEDEYKKRTYDSMSTQDMYKDGRTWAAATLLNQHYKDLISDFDLSTIGKKYFGSMFMVGAFLQNVENLQHFTKFGISSSLLSALSVPLLSLLNDQRLPKKQDIRESLLYMYRNSACFAFLSLIWFYKKRDDTDLSKVDYESGLPFRYRVDREKYYLQNIVGIHERADVFVQQKAATLSDTDKRFSFFSTSVPSTFHNEDEEGGFVSSGFMEALVMPPGTIVSIRKGTKARTHVVVDDLGSMYDNDSVINTVTSIWEKIKDEDEESYQGNEGDEEELWTNVHRLHNWLGDLTKSELKANSTERTVWRFKKSNKGGKKPLTITSVFQEWSKNFTTTGLLALATAVLGISNPSSMETDIGTMATYGAGVLDARRWWQAPKVIHRDDKSNKPFKENDYQRNKNETYGLLIPLSLDMVGEVSGDDKIRGKEISFKGKLWSPIKGETWYFDGKTIGDGVYVPLLQFGEHMVRRTFTLHKRYEKEFGEQLVLTISIGNSTEGRQKKLRYVYYYAEKVKHLWFVMEPRDWSTTYIPLPTEIAYVDDGVAAVVNQQGTNLQELENYFGGNTDDIDSDYYEEESSEEESSEEESSEEEDY